MKTNHLNILLCFFTTTLNSCGTEVGNGFVEDETVAEGEDGEQGPKGEQGDKGDGEPASSPIDFTYLKNVISNICASPAIGGAAGSYTSIFDISIVISVSSDVYTYAIDGEEFQQQENLDTVDDIYDAVALNYEPADYTCEPMDSESPETITYSLTLEGEEHQISWTKSSDDETIISISIDDLEFSLENDAN